MNFIMHNGIYIRRYNNIKTNTTQSTEDKIIFLIFYDYFFNIGQSGNGNKETQDIFQMRNHLQVFILHIGVVVYATHDANTASVQIRRHKYVGTNTSPTNFRHFPHLFNPYKCVNIIISTNGLEINNLSPLLRVSSCYFMRKTIKKT